MLELSSNSSGYRRKKRAVNFTMCFGIECQGRDKEKAKPEGEDECKDF
jgi:hypothetical protein